MHTIRRLSSLLVICAVTVLPVYAGEPLLPAPVSDFVFHRVQPLGVDAFFLNGRKEPISVMASAVSPEMEGWSRMRQGRTAYVVGADGQRVRQFPEDVQFRVTLSARTHLIPTLTPATVKTEESLNDYLLHVQFRLKIFHELQSREVEPIEVHVLGVPADVTYEERIYRVSFHLPKVPVSDRMILEVFSPEGERIMRFHFEVM